MKLEGGLCVIGSVLLSLILKLSTWINESWEIYGIYENQFVHLNRVEEHNLFIMDIWDPTSIGDPNPCLPQLKFPDWSDAWVGEGGCCGNGRPLALGGCGCENGWQ